MKRQLYEIVGPLKFDKLYHESYRHTDVWISTLNEHELMAQSNFWTVVQLKIDMFCETIWDSVG
jgi:hypothetical protein